MEDKGGSLNQRRERLLKTLTAKVEPKEIRKLKTRQQNTQEVWFWLGMFGIVGWSIAVPTLMGVAAGVWIDTKWPSRYSWTLMLLMAGVMLGCLNAWYWVTRESRRH